MTPAVKGCVGGKLVWLFIVEVNGNCEGIDVELAWLLVGLVLLLFCVDDCEEIVDKCEEVSPYAVDWLEASVDEVLLSLFSSSGRCCDFIFFCLFVTVLEFGKLPSIKIDILWFYLVGLNYLISAFPLFQ